MDIVDIVDIRFNYYIKKWSEKLNVSVPENTRRFCQNCLYFYQGPNIEIEGFPYHYGTLKPGFWWSNSEFLLDIPCLSISADGIDNYKLPAIAKVRYINDEYGSILAPLNYWRHWADVQKAKSNKTLWTEKIDECVWRGAPTGIQDSGSDPDKYKNKRIQFCHRYSDKYNVGIVCTWNRWNSLYLKSNLSLDEMLKYKYQISISGNDKDSGLNWKLASKSLVLMSIPKIESWLMEGLLEPYVHYVPLKDDYSDLDIILEWCRSNDNKCQEIVENANKFMKQFENSETEQKIFNMIKEHYKNTFIFN